MARGARCAFHVAPNVTGLARSAGTRIPLRNLLPLGYRRTNHMTLISLPAVQAGALFELLPLLTIERGLDDVVVVFGLDSKPNGTHFRGDWLC